MSDFIKKLEELKRWVELNANSEDEYRFAVAIVLQVGEIIKSVSEKEKRDV
jgi:hypothetical protein